MPATPLARSAGTTLVGKLFTSLSLGGVQFSPYVMDASLTINAEAQDGRTIVDTNSWPIAGRFSASLEATKRTVGPLPVMITALSNTPYFTGIFRNSPTAESYTGTFVIASARWQSGGTDFQSEQISCVSQGTIASSLPTSITDTTLAASPYVRADQASTVISKQLSSLIIGTVNDYLNVYTDIAVNVAIDSYAGEASLDLWKNPIPKTRKITISATRVIQSLLPGTAVSATPANLWTSATAGTTLVIGTLVPVTITNTSGGTTFTAAAALVTQSKITVSDDTQKESIELEIQGSITGA